MTGPYTGPVQSQPAQPQVPQPQNGPVWAPMPTQNISSSEPFQQMPAPDLRPQVQPQPGQYSQPQVGQPVNQSWQFQQQPSGSVPQQLPQQSQPQLQQQPGQPAPQHGGVRLDTQGRVQPGPGIPQELVGKDLNAVMKMYGMVRDGYVESQTALGQHPQAQQPQVQAPPASQQVAAGAPGTDFWANPTEAIKRIVQQEMQPVTQQTTRAAVIEARNSVATAFPEYAQHEAEVIQRLQGASPELLADPNTWRNTFMLIAGERAYAQRQSALQTPAPSQQQQMPWNPNQPVVDSRSFFTESPTGQGASSGVTLGTPEQEAVRQKFHLTPEQYYGSAAPAMPAPQWGGR